MFSEMLQAFAFLLSFPLYIQNHSDKPGVYLKILAMAIIAFDS